MILVNIDVRIVPDFSHGFKMLGIITRKKFQNLFHHSKINIDKNKKIYSLLLNAENGSIIGCNSNCSKFFGIELNTFKQINAEGIFVSDLISKFDDEIDLNTTQRLFGLKGQLGSIETEILEELYKRAISNGILESEGLEIEDSLDDSQDLKEDT
jgi:hypothetical protein